MHHGFIDYMYVSLDVGDETRKKMGRGKEILRSQKATGALIAGRRLLHGGSTQGRIGERARMKSAKPNSACSIIIKHSTLYVKKS